MLRVYMRVGDQHCQDTNYLVLTLEPEHCLFELRTLWRALDPKYVSAGILGSGDEGWYYQPKDPDKRF